MTATMTKADPEISLIIVNYFQEIMVNQLYTFLHSRAMLRLSDYF